MNHRYQIGYPVGILGTPATLAHQLYQTALRDAGHAVMTPSPQDLQYCVDAIEHVKAGRMEDAFEAVSRSVRELIAQGARAVVLGCTELPLALPHHHRSSFQVVLTDSIDALAKRAVRMLRPHAQ